jgi:hypothetical protein
MEAAIRRSVMQRRGDVEAAEELAKYLEAMGYNLDGESFYTKRTGPQFERYAADAKKDKVRKRTTDQQDDNDDYSSDEEESSEDESDDSSSGTSYNGSSEESEDEDSSDDDSSEEKRRSTKSKKKTLAKKKNRTRQGAKSKSSRGFISISRRSRKTGNSENSRSKVNKVQVFRAREEQPLPYKASDKNLVAIPVTESKHSGGFGRFFKREGQKKKTKHFAEINLCEHSNRPVNGRNSVPSRKMNLSHFPSGTTPSQKIEKPRRQSKLDVPSTSSNEREEYAVTTQESTSSEWERPDVSAPNDGMSFPVNPEETKMDRKSPFPRTANQIESIEASSTAMNEGGLEIPLKATTLAPIILQDDETIEHGEIVGEEELEEGDRVVNQNDSNPKTVSRLIGGLGTMIRVPGKEYYVNDGTKEKKESNVKSFFRRNFPTIQSSKPPPTSTFEQAPESADHPESKPNNRVPALLSPSESLNNVMIEGMSLVKQSELLDDQNLEDRMMKVIDVAEIEDEPVMTQAVSSPRRRNRFGLGSDRGRSKSPFNRFLQVTSKKKSARSRSRSRVRSKSFEEREIEPPQYATTGPSVSFELPPEQSQTKENLNEISHKEGRKKFQVGKVIGKILSRKDKESKTMRAYRPNNSRKGNEAMEVFQDGSFAASYEDKTKATLQTRSETLDNKTMEDDQGLALGSTPKGTIGSEAARDQVSMEEDKPEVFKVEVDNEANHAFDDVDFMPDERATDKGISKKYTSEKEETPVPEATTKPVPETTASIDVVDNDEKPLTTEKSTFYAAMGDFMCTTLTASEVPMYAHSIPYKNALNIKSKAKPEQKSHVNLEKSTETDHTASKLENEMQTSTSKVEAVLPSRSKSTSLRSGTKNSSRLIDFPTADDISFTPSLESLDIVPRPNEWRRAKAHPKATIKSSTSNDSQKKGRKNIMKKIIPFPNRSRSVPIQSSKPKKQLAKNCKSSTEEPRLTDGSPMETKDPAAQSHIIESERKKTTQTFEARVEPEIHATNKLHTSLLSPQSNTAIANPLSPSFAHDDEDTNSSISSHQGKPNLDMIATTTTKDWASIVQETDPPLAIQATGKSWAEVHNAANVLGKAMNHVGANTSVDTADEVQQLQRLLSNDSIGDIEQALQTLKRHARRLGVPESDLLLATVKSEDTELMSVRSLTFGEELMDFMNTLVRGNNGSSGGGRSGRR